MKVTLQTLAPKINIRRGLGEMFEGYYADTCGEKFPLMSMGAERSVPLCGHGSEDPHRRQRNIPYFFSFLFGGIHKTKDQEIIYIIVYDCQIMYIIFLLEYKTIQNILL